MLHLAPRFQAAQEQRAACRVQGSDLTQITRFATLLPGAFVDGQGSMALHLRTLPRDARLPPFYLEHVLARLEKSLWIETHTPDFYLREANGDGRGQQTGAADQLEIATTDAMRRAYALLHLTEPVLQPLHWNPDGRDAGQAEAQADSRRLLANRRDAFGAALRQGDRIARVLEAHLIDPIRQDNLAPNDPFVQTTLYVVAPLYEPLTSAAIWPTVAHLLAHLGRRHVAQVVGLFAVGSYARDRSRVYENAAAYAALAEMEALAGRRQGTEGQALRSLVQGRGVEPVPGQAHPLDEWVGESLFDRVYLLDREKSNQGLAQSSYELSVLAGNALEAMITADGGHYIEDQLGIDLRNAQDRPYSLVGAACDYVPLDYIFQAVSEQEEKRLVREMVLTPTGGGESDPPTPTARLADLGIAPGQVLTELVTRLPALFRNVTPRAVDDLQVHAEFVFSPVAAARLRGLPPESWRAACEEHLALVGEEFDALVGADALDAAWGLTGHAASEDVPGRRLLPTAAAQIRAYLAGVIAARPGGLLEARQQVRAWMDEIETTLQQLGPTETLLRRHSLAESQLAVRNWSARYRGMSTGAPSLGGALGRATLLLAGILLVAGAYMAAFSRPFDLQQDGGVLAGLVVGLYVGAIVAYRRRLRRLQRLRRERVELAQGELTARLQHQVRRGLVRVYEHLYQSLRQLHETLDEGLAALDVWALTEGPLPVPPDGLVLSHLRQPHVTPALWERCQLYLRSRQDPTGLGSEERLLARWGSLAWRRELEAGLAPRLGEGATPVAELVRLIRQTVSESVTSLHASGGEASRAELMGRLGAVYNIEHVLWRDAAVGEGGRLGPRATRSRLHQCLERLWNNAKPAANYDVADRLATHGITVDFAAVSGRPDSDLTPAVLRDFRVNGLPSGNLFQVCLVRTVHGLGLDDLDSVHRYRAELVRLQNRERRQILLTSQQMDAVYDLGAPCA